MNMNRRGLLVGLMSALAAPAIVHAGNLMPINSKLLVPTPKAMTWIIEGIGPYGEFLREEFAPSTAEDWGKRHQTFSIIDKIYAPDFMGGDGHMLWSSRPVANYNQYDTISSEELGSNYNSALGDTFIDPLDRTYSGRFLPSA